MMMQQWWKKNEKGVRRDEMQSSHERCFLLEGLKRKPHEGKRARWKTKGPMYIEVHTHRRF